MILPKDYETAETIKSRHFGENISASYKLSSSIKSNDILNDMTTSFSVPMDHNQMHNIRNEYYLKIINKYNAKEHLLEKIKYLVLGLESSGDLKRYTPTEQDPIYVFKDNINVAKIT